MGSLTDQAEICDKEYRQDKEGVDIHITYEEYQCLYTFTPYRVRDLWLA